jgi:hypothetical protein
MWNIFRLLNEQAGKVLAANAARRACTGHVLFEADIVYTADPLLADL